MSIMKKILAVVATVSILATSMVAYAATPTVKTTLMTGEEIAMYTGSQVGGGVKIGFENFDSAKTLGGFVFSVMVPTDLKVMVNTGTQFAPNWTKQAVSESNIAGAVNSTISWTAIKLQDTVGSFYKFGFTAGGQSFAPSGEIILCFTTDAETYTLPEKAFEVVDMSLSYSGESNPIALTVENYFDTAKDTIKVDSEEEVVADADAGTKTYGVTVGSDLVADGKIKAVLTNSHDDAATDNKQEVALSFGTGITGGADCVFDVIVHLQNYAKYADYVTLAIEKVAAN